MSGDKYKKNNLGLCSCKVCKAGRRTSKTCIDRLKRIFRRSWKSNKQVKKGLYTD